MSRVRVKNTLKVKVFVIIGVVIFTIAILALAVSVLIKDKNNNVFDLGNVSNSVEYTDKIVNSSEEFYKLTKSYNVEYSVPEEDFYSHSYLFLFQDYNPCGEKTPKTVEGVDVSDSVTVTFKTHSKCGWCQRHMVLYIVEIEKVLETKNIEYRYIFPNKQLNCGTIK